MNASKIQCTLKTNTGLTVALSAYPISENEPCPSFSPKTASFIPKRIEERRKIQQDFKEQNETGISLFKVSVLEDVVYTEVLEIFF
ncbi:MAG: hypothetical protein IJR47_02480 [Clostridia bacterium]|nr:hypothetical protein [Clostridia bacterium]